MSKARGQSLNRAIKRGNAVVFYNTVTKSVDVCFRKGTWIGRWKNAVRNKVETDELC